MKACFILLFSVLSFVLQSQSTWISYLSPQKDFSVSVPHAPEVHTKELFTEIGKLRSYNYTVAMDKKSNNFLYSINSVIYPEGTFSHDSIDFNDETLAAQVTALSTNLKCAIIYQNKTTISDHQAYAFRLGDERSGQVVKGMIVLYKDTLYTVTVFTLLDRSLNKDIDAFLQSFALIQ